MIGAIAATPLSGADLDALARALTAEGLPADDLREGGRQFFCLRELDGRDLGYAGFEFHGTDALLRSVVVIGERNRGHGRRLVSWAVDHARQAGVNRLYLLTTTAEGFFRKQGFRPEDRERAPQAIRETRTFASLCPASAVFLLKDLAAPPDPL
jgi:N-acetylglutamate synthase-like GNAT family acetyltransferase